MRHCIVMAMIVLAGVLDSAAHAQGDGSNWGKITEVYVDAKMSVMYVKFSREIVNPANCDAADFYMRELDGSEASDRFVRVVLAAHLANRKVKFWVDGCTKSQWWAKTHPVIHDIYIGK